MSSVDSPSILSCLRDIERYSENWAFWLASQQIIYGDKIDDLRQLDGVVALRSGRVFDTRSIVQNTSNPRLWKVGLVGDVQLKDFDHQRTLDSRIKLNLQRRWGSKISRYLFGVSKNRYLRITNYIKGRLIHLCFGRNCTNPHIDTDWALKAGVNFLQLECGSFICADFGAIYEDYLTTDVRRYPSQVGIDLYTTSNSAYLFDWMSSRSDAEIWTNAKRAAEIYFCRFYTIPRQRLEFDHREFDFTPLRLTYGASLASSFSGWATYDPVNVYGLRWDNMAQAPERRTRLRLWVARWTIASNQSLGGLIRDNHMGRAVQAGDLTYHQYCLAGLALGNLVLQDAFVDQIIQSGLAYSTSLQLPNGEVSYYGRGANNIYHLAAYVAAMSVAAVRYKWNVAMPLSAAVNRLMCQIEFSNSLGNAPPYSLGNAPPSSTAMNEAALQDMVGWHGSCAQYGAQSAFLLARSVGSLNSAIADIGIGNMIPIPSVIKEKYPIHARIHAGSGACSLTLSVTSGSECIRWNGGQHTSGFAGLTALYFYGKNRLLTNERVVQDDGRVLLLADLPDQGEYDFGRIFENGSYVCLIHSGNSGTRKVEYRVSDSSWTVSFSSPGRQAIYCLGLQGDIELTEVSHCGFRISFSDGVILHASSEQRIHVDSIDVERSCQGAGSLLQISTTQDHLLLLFTIYK